MKLYHRSTLAVFCCVLCASEVLATIFIPIRHEDLARSSVATVIGVVVKLDSVSSHEGKVFTLVDVAVEQVLDGEVPAPVITLKEPGGAVGEIEVTVFGAPSYDLGERALIFLTVWPDGSLRTNHLALGKFALGSDPAGAPVARQDYGPGTTVLVPADRVRPSSVVPLASLLRSVENGSRDKVSVLPRTGVLAAPPEADDPSLFRESTRAFTLYFTRFFEADAGKPLSFVLDQTGDLTLGFEVSRARVNDAFAVWTDLASASISLQDGGLTDDLTLPLNAPVGPVSISCPGPHKVRFNDPDDEIPDPVDCSGVLGVGGACSISSETKMINGALFRRAVRGALTLANGFGACEAWTPCNVAEIATHELGHAIGLGHSSEDPNETNATLTDATMYFMARFDGRCAGIRMDDEDAADVVYPTSIPPTITTSDPLPVAIPFEPYSQTLTAIGGTGSFTWSLESGGFPGLELSSDGVISGTPVAQGSTFFRVTATDANGDSHTTVLHIGPRGDANCDGKIGAADLLSLALRLPFNSAAPCQLGDAKSDGTLDDGDFEATSAAIFGTRLL